MYVQSQLPFLTKRNCKYSFCTSNVSSFPTEETAVCLGAEGGIQDVLAIMRGLSNQSTIVASCCTALWSLSIIGQSHGNLATKLIYGLL